MWHRVLVQVGLLLLFEQDAAADKGFCITSLGKPFA